MSVEEAPLLLEISDQFQMKELSLLCHEVMLLGDEDPEDEIKDVEVDQVHLKSIFLSH